MKAGISLVQGTVELCYELANGAKIFWRRIPLPVFMNLVRSCVEDDRTRKTDWSKVTIEGVVFAVQRWEGVWNEDGETPAECNDDNKRLLPVPVMAGIFGDAIEHLPTTADEAKQFARKMAEESKSEANPEGSSPLP